MIAQIFEFTGNPRPRVTQPESAIVLILPVMRIERDEIAKENAIVDLRYLAEITEFDDWGPSPMCRCSLVDYDKAVRDIMGEG